MKVIHRRILWFVIWIIAILAVIYGALFFWGSQYHGILPIPPSQQSALRAALRETRRIEIHRLGSSHAILVITNVADIHTFAEVMTPRWQSFYCMCKGATDTWFIDGAGNTNIANITDEYIKFGGSWAERVVFHHYQAVPPKKLLDVMAQHKRTLDASAHP